MELWRHCESRMHCEYRLCRMLRNWMRLCWDRGLNCVSTLNAGCIGTVNRLTGLCWHYKNVVCWYCECNYVVSRNGLCICAVRECIQAMKTTRKKNLTIWLLKTLTRNAGKIFQSWKAVPCWHYTTRLIKMNNSFARVRFLLSLRRSTSLYRLNNKHNEDGHRTTLSGICLCSHASVYKGFREE